MENQIINKLNSQKFLTSKELVYRDIKLPKVSGIYFLYNRDYILMYIGQSINIRTRVSKHLGFSDRHTQGLAHNFVYVKYIEVDDIENLELYEEKMINLLKPKINKTGNYESEYNKYLINDKHPSNLTRFYNKYRWYVNNFGWYISDSRIRAQIDYDFYGIDKGIESRIFNSRV
jgi:excinuclease UvrABC nuclease subunit